MASFSQRFSPLRALLDQVSSATKTVSEGIAGWFKATASQVPYEVQQEQIEDIQEVSDSNVAAGALKVGDQAPMFTLKNQKNEDISLANALEQGPVIITFYRGRWCPYCNIELRALQRTLGDFKELGASLMAISPQSVEQTQEFAGEIPLDFQALADVGNGVAKEFNIVYKVGGHAQNIFNAFGFNLEEFNGDKAEELPLPATYIIGKDGKIAYAFLDPDYTKRAEPAELISVLKSL